jgi:alpha-galactosidase
MKNWFLLSFFFFFALPVGVSPQKFENLAVTPPLGWNSWNKFACEIDEKLIRETADAMVSSGMKDAGYQYIVIDDCWHGERDAKGFIQPHKQRFPSGMKALGDYIHSKGLKFGIYSDAGALTCGRRPGSRGHEYQDALMYASWGVDYLKYDWCFTEGLNPIGAYTTMRDALRAAGRPIVFSICEWGDNKPWEWAKEVGHLWRTTGDIGMCWDCEEGHGRYSKWGVLRILDRQKPLRKYAGPGHWNDPDMLQVGNGMTTSEDRAHFSLWAMLAAPLMAGNDLRNMSPEARQILTNKDVIAVNQDPLGIQGFLAFSEDGLEVWAKPLSNDTWAICFLNRSNTPKALNFDWKNRIIDDAMLRRQVDAKKITYRIRDLWAKKSLGTTDTILRHTLPGHDVLMLRLDR